MRPALRALAAAIAVFMLIAQLGVTMHSLHLDAKRTDAVCEFCTSGAHLQGAAVCVQTAGVLEFADELPVGDSGSTRASPAIDAPRARAPPQSLHAV